MTLITESYAAEQMRLHAISEAYGSRGFNWAYMVAGIARIERCKSILDYGCGKGTLGDTLKRSGLDARKYDPGVPGFGDPPQPADLVASVDVLEHIEPECLPAVLDHLKTLTRKILFVVIPMIKSKRTMSDGRNTHISLHSADWWRHEFEQRGFMMRRRWEREPDTFVAMMQAPR